ncbi:F-type H+-transporting ATPase subunit gamma [Inquilinus ginsengisoli]|uniref:F0F1 ATP synthase subunit gamma n=1 Tax=Inquilinus ginsengisoli TaxID=363840 RepID=UPI003D1F8ABF
MPSLKDLRNRIASVKSTQKITAAMKMVAASKLRRAQDQAEAGRPYADRMERMLTGLAAVAKTAGQGPKLISGTGKNDVHLLLVITSDRGLAGAFNATVLREARRQIRELQGKGKTVKLFTVGRKGRDSLRRDFANLIVESVIDVGRPKLGFADADGIATRILAMFEAGDFDVCSVVYNKFKSAIAQIITVQQLVPVALPAVAEDTASNIVYEFEPSEEQILAELLPRNLAIQIYKALLESAASEQGARMTAMDNATRNAGDMIKRLTLVYNRTRQAYITKELIEIISGAEAI